MNDAEDYAKKRLEQLMHDRSLLEMWLDRHNHFMSFVRTLASVSATFISIIILYKVL